MITLCYNTHTGPLYYFCQNHNGNGMGGIINVVGTNHITITELNEDTPIGPYTITACDDDAGIFGCSPASDAAFGKYNWK